MGDTSVAISSLSPTEYRALTKAVRTLEHPNLAARIADYAGAPLNRVLAMLPDTASASISRIVERAMLRCLKTAIASLGQRKPQSGSRALSSFAVAVTGGVGGFMGLAALPVELPVTMTIVLRSIADIARKHHEDISSLETRMECLQVLALGARHDTGRVDIGYYAARAFLARASSRATTYFIERGTADMSGQVVNSLLKEITARFSLVVSDRAIASAVPVFGAIGGATINMIFIDHFHKIADSHFTIRRLELIYGPDVVHHHYTRLAKRGNSHTLLRSK